MGLLALPLVAFAGVWIVAFWGVPFDPARARARVPVTPPWALECWIWEDDANTADAVLELLEGCERHDLPVRTVLIDSPWSTRYNDFTVDPTRYPDPARFFRSLEDRGYRVVLWMTPMVDSRNKDTALRDSADFHEHARARGYLANDGAQTRWWKGRGSFIDYSNPEAVAWWHSLQQPLFEWGIDGWKLDGADTLFLSRGFLPWQKTARGWTTTRQYMDLYNREEYRHGLSRNPEFIVLTRALDNRYFPLAHPEGFAPRDAAPVTWVGDRTHEWSSSGGGSGAEADALRGSGSLLDRGFEGALRDILASSEKGYAVVGDDIGGYHGREPIPPALYIRWAQFATFTGLFLNGGHGERRLWKRSPEELEIIRRFSWLHTELVPYLFSHVVACHEGGPSLLRPEGARYQFRCGDDLFIAPIHRDSPTLTFDLPPGSWRWLLDDGKRLEGPATFTQTVSLQDYPVFVRDGAILPLHVSRPYTGFGDRDSAGFVTWAVYPHGTHSFTLHHPDHSGTTTLRVVEDNARLLLSFEGVKKPHILRILRDTRPEVVERDGRALKEGEDWRFEAGRHLLWITTRDAVSGQYTVR